MFHRIVLLSVVIAITNRIAAGAEYSLPERVRVLPVAFVPTDEKPPTDDETKLFIRHVQWSQRRYREMLGEDTFELAESKVKVVKGRKPLDFYRQPPERGAPDIVSELLTQLRVSRFSCPYVFCILLMNSKDNFPEGGGRSINGGVNNGGGMIYAITSRMTFPATSVNRKSRPA